VSKKVKVYQPADILILLRRDWLSIEQIYIIGKSIVAGRGAPVSEREWETRRFDLKNEMEGNGLPFHRRGVDGKAHGDSIVRPRDLCRHAEKLGSNWDWLRDVCRAWAWENGVPYEEACRGHEATPGIAAPVDVGPYKSGTAGRPTSMHLVEAEMDRRHATGKMLGRITDEARHLEAWFTEARKGLSLPPVKWKSIKNKLGSHYRELRASSEGPE
jgi:hypothetical protein